jgi:putative addiction module killer protein
VFEARIHFGSGYRLYFTVQRREVVVLLAGGDKASQRYDIEAAIEVAQLLRNWT